MPRNSAGNYTLPAGNPVVPDTEIESGWANTTLGDIATEMSNSVDKQGRTAMVAPFKLADGSLSAPGLTFNGDANTGIYRIGADEWALVSGGVALITLKTDKIATLLQTLEIGGVSFKPTDYARLDGAAFSGGVSFAGQSTFNGVVSATQNITTTQRMTAAMNPKFMYRPTSNYTITDSGFLTLGTAVYNVGGGTLQSGSTWYAPVAGYYHLTCSLRISSANGLSVTANMNIDGVQAGGMRTSINPDTGARTYQFSTTRYMDANSSVSVYIYVSGQGNATLEVGNGEQTFLSGFLIP